MGLGSGNDIGRITIKWNGADPRNSRAVIVIDDNCRARVSCANFIGNATDVAAELLEPPLHPRPGYGVLPIEGVRRIEARILPKLESACFADAGQRVGLGPDFSPGGPVEPDSVQAQPLDGVTAVTDQRVS